VVQPIQDPFDLEKQRPPGHGFTRDLAGASDAERIGDAIDVVEPRGDQSDLQDALVVETHFPQTRVIGRTDFCGVFGDLHDVFHHDPFLVRECRLGVVGLERLNKFVVQRNATQKLCVGFDSINAPIGDRNHGGDDFVLAAAQRQIGRHQRAECGKGVIQRAGDEAVRLDDLRATRLGGVNGRGVFDRVK